MKPAAQNLDASASDGLLAYMAEILVVEDEENPRRELSKALTRKGFKVRQAGSNAEAVAQFKSGNVDLILMDVVLNEEPDGIQTAQEIQQDSPEIPVFFVTAYFDDPEYRRRAESKVPNIAGWIPKPIQIPELVHQLKSELRKCESRELSYSDSRARGVRKQGRSKLGQSVKTKKNSASASPETPMESVTAEIYAVYDEMRALIVSNARKPGLREALVPLRAKLRDLQSQEAALIAKRYDAHFSPLYEEVQDEIRRARQLLGGKGK